MMKDRFVALNNIYCKKLRFSECSKELIESNGTKSLTSLEWMSL